MPRGRDGGLRQVSGFTRRQLLTLDFGRSARPAVAPARPERSWVQRLDAPAPRPEPRRLRRSGRALPIHRPPGAVAEAEFLAGCTKCSDCAGACPHEAIRPGGARLGAAQGTPVIDAASAPCYSCEDRRCATACLPGVLSPRGSGRMGEARIVDHSCLAVRGVGCSTCVEQCPVPGAIRLERGRPRIDPEHCTGCGVCLFVCPAPQKAILLLPARARESQVMESP